MKLWMAGDDMKAIEPWSSLMDKRNDGPTFTSLNTGGVVSSGNSQIKKADSRSQVSTYVNSQYIACGSETNEVFVYHKEISRQLTSHQFGSPDAGDVEDDAGSNFISAVCWESDSPTILSANSQGTIKVIQA
ncbi:E3 ubiquitin-protein ligase COP1, partial [Cucurbita argyrosperma subsp. sororia]